MNKNKIGKRILSIITSALCVFMLIGNVACAPKTVDLNDYPTPIETEVKVDDGNEEEGEEVEEKPVIQDLPEELRPDPDTLRERGTYVYNPTAIHPAYREQVKENTTIIRVAKIIMQSVYDLEDTIDLKDEECTSAEFKLAYQLAAISSPLVNVAYINYDDMDNITITYFPSVEYDEFNEVVYGEESNKDAAKDIFENFENYVTETINNNLTGDSTDAERAEVIYTQIIKDLTLKYSDNEDAASVEDQVKGLDGQQDVGKYSLVDQVYAGELDFSSFVMLYQFFMTQLNINCLVVGAMADYQPQNFSKIDAEMEGSSGWFWEIITV
ncbi:MAG: hypothetical protein K5988_03090, partial [Lachnospiraceae bacterium]|nr:hypothetical protein [Lachnospiraceae bacterium]